MQELALERVRDPPRGSIPRPPGMPPQIPDLTPCKASVSLSERRDGAFATARKVANGTYSKVPGSSPGPFSKKSRDLSPLDFPGLRTGSPFCPLWIRSTNRGPLFCSPAPSHPVSVRLTLFHSTLLTRLVCRSSRRRRDRRYDQ